MTSTILTTRSKLRRLPVLCGLAFTFSLFLGTSGCGNTTREHRVRDGQPPVADAFGTTTQSERERQRSRYREFTSTSIGSIVQYDRRTGSSTIRLREDAEADTETRFFVATDLDNNIKGILGIAAATNRQSAFIPAFLLEGRVAMGDPVRHATPAEKAELSERHSDRMSVAGW